jgi:hypothetical protein
MSTISNIGKIAYIYDQPTDTWHPVAGMTDTSADITWTGDHTFSSSSDIVINKTAVAKNGINNFGSVSERNTKIPTPTDGTFALFVNGTSMYVQYYHAGAWRLYGSDAYLEERTSANMPDGVTYTIQASDAGKTLDMNLVASHTVKVPLDSTANLPIGSQLAFIQANTGQTAFEGEAVGINSVTILSKNSNKKLASRYSQGLLIKKAANTWYLMGDLTA